MRATEETASAISTSPGSESTDEYPSNIYAWYVTSALLIANIVSFIDRQIISLLIEPIKADLMITDTQISLLHGFAFAIFYAIMGVPLGRLADTRSRQKIVVVGIAVWSLMTAFCGLARNFGMFFLARIGVGVGEAALSPCAYSMVSDCFPKNKRSKPISLIAMGPYVGGGLSFMIGGTVVQLVSQSAAIELPLLGVMQPWQLTFIIVGLPGVFVSLLFLFTVKEPTRKDKLVVEENSAPLPMSATVEFMKSHLRVYATLIFGYSTTAMLGYGLLAWIPTLFIRNHGWSPAEVGLTFGLIVLLFGGGGTFLGGVCADWLLQKGHSDAYLRTSVYGMAGLVAFILAPLMPSTLLILCLLSITMVFLGLHIGVGMAGITQITPNEFRGQVLAVYLFFLVLIGAGAGPFFVAIFTDYIFENSNMVHYSISLFGAIFVPVAFLLFYSGLKPFGRMMGEIKH